jgi:hypothetical protein
MQLMTETGRILKLFCLGAGVCRRFGLQETNETAGVRGCRTGFPDLQFAARMAVIVRHGDLPLFWI